jgi:hypothetical protein
MGEKPLNDDRVLNRGDQLHAPRAARTMQDVQVKGAAHQQTDTDAA